MRKIVLFISIVIVVIAGLVWLANYKTTFPVPKTRSNAEFSRAIIKAKPILANKEGQPIFDILGNHKIANHWYVVLLRQKNTPTGVVSKIVIHDPYFDAQRMSVVAGPATNFSTTNLTQFQLPASVVKGIVK